jgi:hypothetical protein
MARSLDSGGLPPDDGDMEDRLARLETLAEQSAAYLATLAQLTRQNTEHLNKLELDVADIRSNYASKEDLYKAIDAQTWRLVTFVCGFGTALAGATYFIATHVR